MVSYRDINHYMRDDDAQRAIEWHIDTVVEQQLDAQRSPQFKEALAAVKEARRATPEFRAAHSSEGQRMPSDEFARLVTAEAKVQDAVREEFLNNRGKMQALLDAYHDRPRPPGFGV